MDEDAYERLSLINVQLIQLCRWLNEKRNIDTASRLIPIMDDLTHLVAELRVKQKCYLQPWAGVFFSLCNRDVASILLEI